MALVTRVSPSGPVAPSGVGSQDLEEVLTEGNDGGGLAIENIADPTNPQDAATKAYVDSHVGAAQNLAQVLAVGNSAGARITNLTNPAAAQDADTLSARNTAITAAIAAIPATPTPSLGAVMSVGAAASTDLDMNLREIFDLSYITMGATIDQDGSIAAGLLRQKFFGSANVSDASWYCENIGAGNGGAVQSGHTRCSYEVVTGAFRVNWPTTIGATGDVMIATVSGSNVNMAFAAPPSGATPTLAAVLAAGNSAGARITNLTDPSAAQDAATKAYVDAAIPPTPAGRADITVAVSAVAAAGFVAHDFNLSAVGITTADFPIAEIFFSGSDSLGAPLAGGATGALYYDGAQWVRMSGFQGVYDIGGVTSYPNAQAIGSATLIRFFMNYSTLLAVTGKLFVRLSW